MAEATVIAAKFVAPTPVGVLAAFSRLGMTGSCGEWVSLL
jgi:hypothetical protein